jgi:hypothetical protein
MPNFVFPRASALLGRLLCLSWLAIAVAPAACQSAKVQGGRPQPGGAGAGPGGEPGPGGPGFALPDGGAAADADVTPRPPGSGQQCVEEAITGEMIPLDLMLVLDASGSMRVLVGGKTRWQQVSDALGAFVRDPRSTGLGVGLQVFPFTIFHKPCTTDADCDGFGGGPAGYWCTRPFVCNGAGVALDTARTCDPNDAYCPEAGTRCAVVGRCSRSGSRCANLGQACPGGAAGDLCVEAPTVCKMQIDSCAATDYARPRVAIGALPAFVGDVTQGMADVKPGGNTPITPAVEGAARYLREHLDAHPGRRGALVLATDVAPSGCQGDTIDGVAAAIQAARMATPAVSTYVIGAVSPGDMVRTAAAGRLAQAGGTTTAFILNDAAPDLGNRFLDALSAIRGNALACEFSIPTPRNGALDYGKVNVRFTSPAGMTDLVYVGSAAGCDPTKGGWYYNVDPAMGTPTTIQVCPASCARFKAEAGGSVQLRFGCKTRID